MTAVSTNWVPAGDTGAKLYACTKVMSDALTEVGLLKTSDTGQIDLSAITAITPPTTVPIQTPTEYAYEMRRLESAGKPTVYIRVSYCVVATTANAAATYRVAVYFRAGTFTNGAGALGGTVQGYDMSTYVANSGPTSSVSMTFSRNLFVASDGANYLTVVNDPQSAATTSSAKYAYMNFFCERTVDYLSGAYDGEGFISGHCGVSSHSLSTYQLLNFTSGTAYSAPEVPYQVPGSLFTSSGALSTATIMPLAVVTPNPKGPAIGSVLAYAADTTAGGQYDIAMYGVTRRYMDIGNQFTARWPYLSAAQSRALVRFD
ncbi:MAG: hypothetical protein DI635_00870 [Pseudoxanthomonas suwonensis]|nr:MAG: hypothetical protein DI635_00870 [Pseudoxanthomonas suwonensis]